MEEDVTHESPDRGPAHRILSVLGLVAVLAGAVLGGNPFGIRESVFGSAVPPPRPPAVGREAAEGVDDDATVLRSQPWWQTVAHLRGTGQMVTPAFTIGGDALQWRVRTSCTDRDIAVEVSTEAEPLVAAACPSPPDGYSSETGDVSLRVAAKGSWKLHIEQQIDVPLEEPPLPAMTASGTKEIAAGSLYRMERPTSGRVQLYRLAGGDHALRLSDFYVSPNIDLELRFSSLEAPRTTQEFEGASSVFVAPLDITAGSLNFKIPASVDPTEYRSLVIWCPPLNLAYAGARLEFRA